MEAIPGKVSFCGRVLLCKLFLVLLTSEFFPNILDTSCNILGDYLSSIADVLLRFVSCFGWFLEPGKVRSLVFKRFLQEKSSVLFYVYTDFCVEIGVVNFDIYNPFWPLLVAGKTKRSLRHYIDSANFGEVQRRHDVSVQLTSVSLHM